MGIEEQLLEAMAAGQYDDAYTDRETNGVWWRAFIEDGIPVERRDGAAPKPFFDGKENTRSAGRKNVKRFETDEEKIDFLRPYGWKPDMFGDHPEVMAYSKAWMDATGRGRRR